MPDPKSNNFGSATVTMVKQHSSVQRTLIFDKLIIFAPYWGIYFLVTGSYMVRTWFLRLTDDGIIKITRDRIVSITTGCD